MPKYKLTIAYDGTAYDGWQAQPGRKTIEGTLRSTFRSIFNHEVSILGASRTDAGVHAHGNMVRIETDIAVDADRMLFALNNILPADIVVRECEQTETFHPFYNVAAKEYHYHFFDTIPSPFFARYGWFVGKPIDHAKLEAVLALYHGTYDFSQFTSTDDSRTDKVRTVDHVRYERSDLFPAGRIVVVGKKFLHTMVRRMVGTAMYVATQEHATVDVVKRMLEEQLKTDYTLKAPAQGLLLHSITYEHVTLKDTV